MNYFKSLAKSVYQTVESVVEDEYIEPITEAEVYSILNRKRSNSNRFMRMYKKDHRTDDSGDDESSQVLSNIDRLSLISPEIEFKFIGDDYNFEIVNHRVKELRKKEELVKAHMTKNYQTNLNCIETALLHISDLKPLHNSKQKSELLRARIAALKKIVERTVKITKLNIKITNIKKTLKIAGQIPNVKKMTLFELKAIDIGQLNTLILSLKASSKEQSIKCIENLEYYIDKASSEQLRTVINDITRCLNALFENTVYEKAIKDFIVSKSSIQFQKLLIRLTETEIRDKISNEFSSNQQQEDPKSIVFEICNRYLSILINLFKLIRWHRYNLAVSDDSEEIQAKIRERKRSVLSNCSETSEDGYPVINLDLEDGIKINIEEVKNHVCGMMDQCLKERTEEILFNNETISNEEIFELLILLESFFQIAYSFSSYVFLETLEIVKEILLRKSLKIQQKGFREFNETLTMEEGNQWNRLPVSSDFRHKSIDRSLRKISKICSHEKYLQICENHHKFLNLNEHSDPSTIQIEEVQNNQNMQLEIIKLPYEHLDMDYPVSASSFSSNGGDAAKGLKQYKEPQVVICQSSLTILNYFQQLVRAFFYIPIREIQEDALDKMSFFIEYYIYYIFETFLSSNFKSYLFNKYEETPSRYLQKRVRKSYQNLFAFVKGFRNNLKELQKRNSASSNNSRVSKESRRKMSMENAKLRQRGFAFVKVEIKQSKLQTENMVKARAMASQSIKYVIAYFEHIVRILKDSKISAIQHPKEEKLLSMYLQRVEKFKGIQSETSDILLTDSIPQTTRIDFVDPIIKKIKWHEVENSRELLDYGSMILKNIQEVYDKMRSMSKGEIPSYVIDKIFGFYWKTELTYMTKLFLNEHIAAKQRGGRVSKLSYEKLIDVLFEGVVDFVQFKKKKQLKSTKSLGSGTEPEGEGGSILRDRSFGEGQEEHIKSSYLKIKGIFPIILESDWEQCLEMVKQSLLRHDFIYKITLSIVLASESCSKQSEDELLERQTEVDEFIEERVLQ